MGIICFQPALVMAALDAILGRDEHGWKGVRRKLWKEAMPRHPVSFCAVDNPVKTLADYVQSIQPLCQRRSMCGDVRVFVVTKCAGVTGGMVGQQSPIWTDLKNVQPVASERIKSRVGINAGNLWKNRDHIEAIFDFRILNCCCRERNFYLSIRSLVTE